MKHPSKTTNFLNRAGSSLAKGVVTVLRFPTEAVSYFIQAFVAVSDYVYKRPIAIDAAEIQTDDIEAMDAEITEKFGNLPGIKIVNADGSDHGTARMSQALLDHFELTDGQTVTQEEFQKIFMQINDPKFRVRDRGKEIMEKLTETRKPLPKQVRVDSETGEIEFVDSAEHLDYYVTVAGVKDDDGNPARISMDKEAWELHGFTELGQEITMKQVKEMLGEMHDAVVAAMAKRSIEGADEETQDLLAKFLEDRKKPGFQEKLKEMAKELNEEWPEEFKGLPGVIVAGGTGLRIPVPQWIMDHFGYMDGQEISAKQAVDLGKFTAKAEADAETQEDFLKGPTKAS